MDKVVLFRVLREPEVLAMTGFASHQALAAAINRGEFPKPIKLTSKSVGWLQHEVTAWIERKIAERDAAIEQPAGDAEQSAADPTATVEQPDADA